MFSIIQARLNFVSAVGQLAIDCQGDGRQASRDAQQQHQKVA